MADMIENPEDYFRQLLPPRDALLLELEQEAEREDIPIVGPLVGQLLYLLTSLSGAERILEVGTATGYSALYLSRALDPDRGRLVTIEKKPEMAARAAANIRKAGLQKLVEFQIGEALEQLDRLQPGFDLVFLDIDKKSYVDCLPHCERLLRPGGLLIADNVRFVDADRFNKAISSSTSWRSLHLYGFLPAHSPEMDALCLAQRL